MIELCQPEQLKNLEGLPAEVRANIGHHGRDQRDDGRRDPAGRLDLSERRVLCTGRHAAARIHRHLGPVTSGDRVADAVQHHHLGREAGDDQMLPTGCGYRGAGRFIQARE